jgi:hypothetical protein
VLTVVDGEGACEGTRCASEEGEGSNGLHGDYEGGERKGRITASEESEKLYLLEYVLAFSSWLL